MRNGPVRLLILFAALWSVQRPSAARAQEKPAAVRPASFLWDSGGNELRVSLTFRDVIDGEVRRKLSRGLPTTIVLTAALYVDGTEKPVSTTAQTCKITWHVWHEMYLVESTHPDGSRTHWVPTLEGVLSRCAETKRPRLLVASKGQAVVGARVFLKGRIQINPISPEILGKIKRWVSRPIRTGTAAPGDALFSTFTGLFMQRIGEAEKSLDFVTPASVPAVAPEAKKNAG